MLKVHLSNNQHLRVLSAQVQFTQNQISTFSIAVQYKDIAVDPTTLRYTDIELIYKNTVVVSGIVEDCAIRPTESGELFVDFKCVDNFGRLGIIKANSLAYYENQPLLFIIDNLLSISTTWELGDVTTMADRDITTTVDLRRKETLWAQIIGALEQVSGTFVRYGGVNPISGKHRIDIGSFGERSSVSLIQGQTIQTLRLEVTSNRPINHIEAYGGNANGTRISLEHALDHDPTLATHPDYPVLSDSAGRYYVVNNNLAVGASIVREYTKIHLEGTPTSTQIEEAGYALWQAVVRDFEIHEATRQHEGTAVFAEDLFGDIVSDLLSREVYTHTVSKQTVVDFTTGIVMPDAIVYQIDTLLRVTSYTINFESGTPVYNLTLSETFYESVEDDSIQLYDALAPTESVPGTATPIAYIGYSSATVTHGPGASTDTYFYAEDPDVYDAKQFSFTPPAAGGATRLSWAIYKVSPHIDYKIEQNPVFGGTPLILSVVDSIIDEWDPIASTKTIGVVWIRS